MHLHFFLFCLFCDPENFTILARIKECQVFLQWRCYSSSGEMETKLNFVLQSKNISQMQVNKNFLGYSWIGFIWLAKPTKIVVPGCKSKRGATDLLMCCKESEDVGFATSLTL